MTNPLPPSPSTGNAVELPQFNVKVDEVRRSPARVKLDLNEQERQALAALNDLPGMDQFLVSATVGTAGKGQMRAEGQIQASFQYRCAVTLEPFDADLNISFDELFSVGKAASVVIDIDALSESDVEPLPDGVLDVADLAFQHFALALDPYPRHPSLASTEPIGDEEIDTAEDGKRPSPFAVLEQLKAPKP
ncbi:MAG: DUF177 domain-containing protein [Cohaesibacteraceae bacterium]